MNIKSPWFIKMPQFIPEVVCERILDEASDLSFFAAKVGLQTEGSKLAQEIRNNSALFLDKNHWFEGVLTHFGNRVNQSAKWNFDISANDAVQISSYNPGEKYDWHVDENILSKLQQFQRKITVVCQLNKSSEYKGGEFYIDGVKDSLLSEQGDIIAFPSYMRHKADEVTEGKRMSAVVWIYGKHFR
jgi:predicted 2-oxoglutarate/Fe(II)-dependent dioxygenase YbiX